MVLLFILFYTYPVRSFVRQKGEIVMSTTGALLSEHWAKLPKNERADLVWRLCGDYHDQVQRYELGERSFDHLTGRLQEELERNYTLEQECIAWLTELNQAVSVSSFCVRRFPYMCRRDVYELSYDPSSRSFRHQSRDWRFASVGVLPPSLDATEVLVLTGRPASYSHDRRWSLEYFIGTVEVIARLADLESERKRISAARKELAPCGF
jgi:hypothetical protein